MIRSPYFIRLSIAQQRIPQRDCSHDAAQYETDFAQNVSRVRGTLLEGLLPASGTGRPVAPPGCYERSVDNQARRQRRIILQGEILKPMEKGIATVIFYKNGSVDIAEWSDEIPVSEVKDARQLLHLIVKDGQVMTSIVRGGVLMSAEIGLGSLLNEEQPITMVPHPRLEKNRPPK